MATEITTGQRVTYTNRGGETFNATVIDVLSAEVFGKPMAVIEFLDGPIAGQSMRKKLTELTPAN